MVNQNGGTNAPNTGIDAIETLVAEIPTCTLEQALAKFQGRRTPKTLAAARRMVAAKKRVKVPRHLLRELWRITWGWKIEWNQSPPGPTAQKTTGLLPGGNQSFEGEEMRVGDLTCKVKVNRPNGAAAEPLLAVLFYRGVAVGRIVHRYGEGYSPWMDNARVLGALAAFKTV